MRHIIIYIAACFLATGIAMWMITGALHKMQTIKFYIYGSLDEGAVKADGRLCSDSEAVEILDLLPHRY